MLDKKVCILHEVKSSDFYTKIETENGKKKKKRMYNSCIKTINKIFALLAHKCIYAIKHNCSIYRDSEIPFSFFIFFSSF